MLGIAFFALVVGLWLGPVDHAVIKPFLLCLTPAQQSTGIVVAASFALPVYFLMFLIETQIRTSAAPNGVLSVQFAFSQARMKEILAGWNPQQLNMMLYQLGTDNLFIPLYSTALAMCCLHYGQRGHMAYRVASLQYLAAAFDFAEGLLVLPVLFTNAHFIWSDDLVYLSGLCAVLKFVFIGIGIVYSVRQYRAIKRE
ncbi:hypothetical protein BASA81_008916 [Batrachochytrium salamandrivorans]|nr:hypothetical protein BASA81_008916 [Batrachochytrium salamandrivorans]